MTAGERLWVWCEVRARGWGCGSLRRTFPRKRAAESGVVRAARSGRAADVCGGWVFGRLEGQPVAAGSSLSLVNAAASSGDYGHVCCRRSFVRRPWNASRAATCSNW